MTNEKFCLRWNDFEVNISSALKELRDDKDFFDVTLACDDEQIQAHKVILSACSPFFRSILRLNPHQHPLLYLKGVKYQELQSVLCFMYQGEVNVAQDDLNSFLSVAEDLRVKGLTQNTKGTPNKPAEPSLDHPHKEPQHLSKTVPRHSDNTRDFNKIRPAVHNPPNLYKPQDNEIQEIVPIKSEPNDNTTPLTPHQIPSTSNNQNQSHTMQENSLTQYQQEVEEEIYDDEYGGQYGDHDQYGLVEQDINTHHSQPYQTDKDLKSPSDLLNYCSKSSATSKWVCTICGQFSHSGRGVVRNHVESKHFPTTFLYHCDYDNCDKISNTKKGMEVHVSRNHKLML